MWLQTSNTSALIAPNTSAAQQSRAHHMRLLYAVKELKHLPKSRNAFVLSPGVCEFRDHRPLCTVDNAVKIRIVWDGEELSVKPTVFACTMSAPGVHLMSNDNDIRMPLIELLASPPDSISHRAFHSHKTCILGEPSDSHI